MALLEIENLTVTLETSRGPARAVRDLNMSIAAGESFGVVGESGCGKSMTALAIMGLLPEGARVDGAIRLDGQDLVGLREAEYCKVRGNRVAMIFQEPMTSLNPLHCIGAQISEAIRLHRGLSKAAAADEVVSLLDRVGIPNPRNRLGAYPHQFSGGQRQRLMIAMALSCHPDLLIADEPTTALDVTTQAQILDLIRELVEEIGMAMLLISHDLGVISQTTQNIMVMYGGMAFETGASDRLFTEVAHPYARGLFAAMPALGRRDLARLPTVAGVVPELSDLAPGCPFFGRCEFGDDHCAAQTPAMTALDSGHAAACWKLDRADTQEVSP